MIYRWLFLLSFSCGLGSTLEMRQRLSHSQSKQPVNIISLLPMSDELETHACRLTECVKAFLHRQRPLRANMGIRSFHTAAESLFQSPDYVLNASNFYGSVFPHKQAQRVSGEVPG